MCNIRIRECIARCQEEAEAEEEVEEAGSTQENYISSYCKQKGPKRTTRLQLQVWTCSKPSIQFQLPLNLFARPSGLQCYSDDRKGTRRHSKVSFFLCKCLLSCRIILFLYQFIKIHTYTHCIICIVVDTYVCMYEYPVSATWRYAFAVHSNACFLSSLILST